MKSHVTTITAALLTIAPLTFAQGTDPARSERTAPGVEQAAPQAMPTTPRTIGQGAMPEKTRPLSEKERLESVLTEAQSRDDYASLLSKEGYEITAVNKSKPTSVEYEIVKGDQTYEVRLAFDGETGPATSVDVASNLWRASETKAKMNAEKTTRSPADLTPAKPGTTQSE